MDLEVMTMESEAEITNLAGDFIACEGSLFRSPEEAREWIAGVL